MTTIATIQQEISLWSRDNFGNQGGVEHLAPLLGVIEEVGELTHAVLTGDQKEIWDAVGDIGIYSLDTLSRANIDAEKVWPVVPSEGVPYSSSLVLVKLGKLCHVFLKSHQGIRGYDDPNFAFQQQKSAFAAFLSEIHSSYNLTEATIETWEKIVKKRNWKKEQANVD